MCSKIPICNSIILLKKYPGKGGWTYAEIPEITYDKNNPFGWVKVGGMIDDFELKQHKLMPLGEGKLFLPVKKEIRNRIKKQEGDFVKVVLFLDDSKLLIPMEIIECFKNEDATVYDTFMEFSDEEQKAYLDWIYSAKTDDTKANRIATMMKRLEKKLKKHNKIQK